MAHFTSNPTSTSASRDAVSKVASAAGEMTQDYARHFVAEPAKDVFALLRDYAHDKPDVAAMWCFGVGLVIGWKLRG